MNSCLNCTHSDYEEGRTNFKCNWNENIIRPHWQTEMTVITIQANQPYINCPAFDERKNDTDA